MSATTRTHAMSAVPTAAAAVVVCPERTRVAGMRVWFQMQATFIARHTAGSTAAVADGNAERALILAFVRDGLSLVCRDWHELVRRLVVDRYQSYWFNRFTRVYGGDTVVLPSRTAYRAQLAEASVQAVSSVAGNSDASPPRGNAASVSKAGAVAPAREYLCWPASVLDSTGSHNRAGYLYNCNRAFGGGESYTETVARNAQVQERARFSARELLRRRGAVDGSASGTDSEAEVKALVDANYDPACELLDAGQHRSDDPTAAGIRLSDAYRVLTPYERRVAADSKSDTPLPRVILNHPKHEPYGPEPARAFVDPRRTSSAPHWATVVLRMDLNWQVACWKLILRPPVPRAGGGRVRRGYQDKELNGPPKTPAGAVFDANPNAANANANAAADDADAKDDVAVDVDIDGTGRDDLASDADLKLDFEPKANWTQCCCDATGSDNESDADDDATPGTDEGQRAEDWTRPYRDFNQSCQSKDFLCALSDVPYVIVPSDVSFVAHADASVDTLPLPFSPGADALVVPLHERANQPFAGRFFTDTDDVIRFMLDCRRLRCALRRHYSAALSPTSRSAAVWAALGDGDDSDEDSHNMLLAPDYLFLALEKAYDRHGQRPPRHEPQPPPVTVGFAFGRTLKLDSLLSTRIARSLRGGMGGPTSTVPVHVAAHTGQYPDVAAAPNSTARGLAALLIRNRPTRISNSDVQWSAQTVRARLAYAAQHGWTRLVEREWRAAGITPPPALAPPATPPPAAMPPPPPARSITTSSRTVTTTRSAVSNPTTVPSWFDVWNRRLTKIMPTDYDEREEQIAAAEAVAAVNAFVAANPNGADDDKAVHLTPGGGGGADAKNDPRLRPLPPVRLQIALSNISTADRALQRRRRLLWRLLQACFRAVPTSKGFTAILSGRSLQVANREQPRLRAIWHSNLFEFLLCEFHVSDLLPSAVSYVFTSPSGRPYHWRHDTVTVTDRIWELVCVAAEFGSGRPDLWTSMERYGWVKRAIERGGPPQPPPASEIEHKFRAAPTGYGVQRLLAARTVPPQCSSTGTVSPAQQLGMIADLVLRTVRSRVAIVERRHARDRTDVLRRLFALAAELKVPNEPVTDAALLRYESVEAGFGECYDPIKIDVHSHHVRQTPLLWAVRNRLVAATQFLLHTAAAAANQASPSPLLARVTHTERSAIYPHARDYRGFMCGDTADDLSLLELAVLPTSACRDSVEWKIEKLRHTHSCLLVHVLASAIENSLPAAQQLEARTPSGDLSTSALHWAALTGDMCCVMRLAPLRMASPPSPSRLPADSKSAPAISALPVPWALLPGRAFGELPVHRAAQRYCPHALTLGHQSGFSGPESSPYGELYTSAFGSLSVVQYFVGVWKVPLTARDRFGNTLLHYAVGSINDLIPPKFLPPTTRTCIPGPNPTFERVCPLGCLNGLHAAQHGAAYANQFAVNHYLPVEAPPATADGRSGGLAVPTAIDDVLCWLLGIETEWTHAATNPCVNEPPLPLSNGALPSVAERRAIAWQLLATPNDNGDTPLHVATANAQHVRLRLMLQFMTGRYWCDPVAPPPGTPAAPPASVNAATGADSKTPAVDDTRRRTRATAVCALIDYSTAFAAVPSAADVKSFVPLTRAPAATDDSTASRVIAILNRRNRHGLTAYEVVDDSRSVTATLSMSDTYAFALAPLLLPAPAPRVWEAADVKAAADVPRPVSAPFALFTAAREWTRLITTHRSVAAARIESARRGYWSASTPGARSSVDAVRLPQRAVVVDKYQTRFTNACVRMSRRLGVPTTTAAAVGVTKRVAAVHELLRGVSTGWFPPNSSHAARHALYRTLFWPPASTQILTHIADRTVRGGGWSGLDLNPHALVSVDRERAALYGSHATGAVDRGEYGHRVAPLFQLQCTPFDALPYSYESSRLRTGARSVVDCGYARDITRINQTGRDARLTDPKAIAPDWVLPLVLRGCNKDLRFGRPVQPARRELMWLDPARAPRFDYVTADELQAVREKYAKWLADSPARAQRRREAHAAANARDPNTGVDPKLVDLTFSDGGYKPYPIVSVEQLPAAIDYEKTVVAAQPTPTLVSAYWSRPAGYYPTPDAATDDANELLAARRGALAVEQANAVVAFYAQLRAIVTDTPYIVASPPAAPAAVQHAEFDAGQERRVHELMLESARGTRCVLEPRPRTDYFDTEYPVGVRATPIPVRVYAVPLATGTTADLKDAKSTAVNRGDCKMEVKPPGGAAAVAPPTSAAVPVAASVLASSGDVKHDTACAVIPSIEDGDRASERQTKSVFARLIQRAIVFLLTSPPVRAGSSSATGNAVGSGLSHFLSHHFVGGMDALLAGGYHRTSGHLRHPARAPRGEGMNEYHPAGYVDVLPGETGSRPAPAHDAVENCTEKDEDRHIPFTCNCLVCFEASRYHYIYWEHIADGVSPFETIEHTETVTGRCEFFHPDASRQPLWIKAVQPLPPPRRNVYTPAYIPDHASAYSTPDPMKPIVACVTKPDNWTVANGAAGATGYEYRAALRKLLVPDPVKLQVRRRNQNPRRSRQQRPSPAAPDSASTTRSGGGGGGVEMSDAETNEYVARLMSTPQCWTQPTLVLVTTVWLPAIIELIRVMMDGDSTVSTAERLESIHDRLTTAGELTSARVRELIASLQPLTAIFNS